MVSLMYLRVKINYLAIPCIIMHALFVQGRSYKLWPCWKHHLRGLLLEIIRHWWIDGTKVLFFVTIIIRV